MNKQTAFIAVALTAMAIGSFFALRTVNSDKLLAEPTGPAVPNPFPVEELIQNESPDGKDMRMSVVSGESADEHGDPQSEEPRGEPWIRLKYEKRVYGCRLGDVLFEFYGQDWEWMEPLFSRHDIDPDEPITINEELGDLEACLPRLPEFL